MGFFYRAPVVVVFAAALFAQSPDGLDLARMKAYSAHRVSSGNRFVNSNDDSKRIMPGETFVMADLKGPGVVNHIWLTVADNEFAWQRLLRLRVYYDGKKTPSIDVPLGDFFGVGHGYDRNLDSMMIRNSSFGRARNSYWSMPFRESCRITVTDEGNRPATMFYYHVDWQKHPSLADDIGYLHAYYRQERPAVKGRNYAFLDIKGAAGHYVGTVLNVIQTDIGWFGEGDDLFYVDGAKHPQILGTGTEDYVNEAWGLRVSTGNWAGTPVAEGELVGARLTGYRWHVPDPVPFTRSLWAGIEHAGWTYNADGSVRSGFEERPDYFSSTAFWYQKGVNETLPEPPYGEARLRLGNAIQIAVEDSLADVKTMGGKASVQKEVDWGRDLLFFEAQDKGARIDIPIDVPETGRYEVLARIAQAPDYGDYIALFDGKPANVDTRQASTSEIPATGPAVIHNYLPEVLVAIEYPLGWLQLTKGRHTLSFICTGKDSRSSGYNLGVNDVVLERVPNPGLTEEAMLKLPVAPGASGPVYRGVGLSAYLREYRKSGSPALLRAIGSFGEDAAPAAEDAAKALREGGPELKVAAAWALSQMGRATAANRAAVGALEAALADGNANVRSLAAVALRALGRGAKPALAGLVKSLDDSSAYVRALAADSIGNVGPDARSTVATLCAHLTAGGEQVFVMRSIATALGSIGSRDAIPSLEKALKHPRVIYTAEEAIKKIKGEPVNTWW